MCASCLDVLLQRVTNFDDEFVPSISNFDDEFVPSISAGCLSPCVERDVSINILHIYPKVQVNLHNLIQDCMLIVDRILNENDPINCSYSLRQALRVAARLCLSIIFPRKLLQDEFIDVSEFLSYWREISARILNIECLFCDLHGKETTLAALFEGYLHQCLRNKAQVEDYIVDIWISSNETLYS